MVDFSLIRSVSTLSTIPRSAQLLDDSNNFATPNNPKPILQNSINTNNTNMSVSSKNSVRSMSSISGSEDSQLDNKGMKVNSILTAPVERKKANSILGYFGSMTKGPSSNAEDVSISNITSIQDTINQKRKDALVIMGLSSKNNVGVPSQMYLTVMFYSVEKH
jgi:hypothetical protein